MMHQPLVTILTPCFNRAGLVAEAIESAIQADYPDIEHLVLDGGSTDGTLEILARYPHLRVLSEADRGMYDALNKGLKLARGQVIGFLNTDDLYAPGVYRRAVDCLREHPQAWAAAGSAELFLDNPGGTRQILATFPPIPVDQLWKRLTTGVPAINAWFFRREVFDRLGGFDLNYPISADREFMLRLAYNGLPYTTFPGLAYSYRQHQGSLTMADPPDRSEPYSEPSYVTEKLQIAEAYLEDPTLPAELRPVMRNWHADITSGQVLYALRYGQFRQAAAHAVTGWRREPVWPLRFIARVYAGQQKKIRRMKGRTP